MSAMVKRVSRIVPFLFVFLFVSTVSMSADYVVRAETVVATVAVGSGPSGVAFDSSSGNIYVSNSLSDSVSVIDGATNKVTSTIQVGTGPSGVAFDSSNGDIYVADTGVHGQGNHINAGGVSVIDGSTNTIVATVPACYEPADVEFDPANGYLYLSCRPDYVSIVDGSTNKDIKNLSAGAQPRGIAIDSANGKIYVTDNFANTVTVISGVNNTVVGTVTVGDSPRGDAYDSANGNIYVASQGTSLGSYRISVINGSSDQVIATISNVGVGPARIAYDSANGNLYVTNNALGTVAVINGTTNTVASTVGVGTSPSGVAFDPTNDDIYVSNNGGASVSVISTSLTSTSTTLASTSTRSTTSATPTTATTTPSTTTTATSPQSTTTPSSGGGGIPGFPYQLGALTAFTLLVAASYFLARRRWLKTPLTTPVR